MKVSSIRSWERHEHRKKMPRELQELLETHECILRVGSHAWTNVQPPLPGAKVDSVGDALKGQGKHFSARIYFDNLDEWLTQWEYAGRAPDGKGKQTEESWEIYIPLPAGEWLLVVVSKHVDNEPYLKTLFKIGTEKVSRRMNQGYLIPRRRE